jgi:alkanesulfonate monooxygenase SsuD/methylene tetrahydromethanopterin reductase-like flavin-dependent oxidoreductase (luciferase family)
MLRISVELPADFASAGEFLADAQAYEAAGAEAVWLAPSSDGLERLTLLAAVAAVTARVRLAAALDAAGPWPPEALAGVARTLDRLSRDRVVLGVEAGGEDGRARELVAALRSVGSTRPILLAGAGEAAATLAARLGDGLLHPAGDAERVGAAFDAARQAGAPETFELWGRVGAPGGRAEWRQALETYAELGATGIVVAHAANLLDILRNPEEDDRQDLAMAVG